MQGHKNPLQREKTKKGEYGGKLTKNAKRFSLPKYEPPGNSPPNTPPTQTPNLHRNSNDEFILVVKGILRIKHRDVSSTKPLCRVPVSRF